VQHYSTVVTDECCVRLTKVVPEILTVRGLAAPQKAFMLPQ